MIQKTDLTLTEFFHSYYVPLRLFESSPCTIDAYQQVVLSWVKLIGDTPMGAIDNVMLGQYRQASLKQPGRKPGTKLSPNTVRSRLAHIQALLNAADALETEEGNLRRVRPTQG